MTNQYIVSYSNNKDEVQLDGFAELIKTNYDIPILSVRTHEDKNHKMNRTLFHQFITNNFAQVEFSDDGRECVIRYPDNLVVIKFDSHSSSAYTDFKNNLSTLLNSKFETENYKSGHTMYVGGMLYVKEDDVIKERRPHGDGVLYFDLPNYKMKYSGEFTKGLPDGAGVFYNKTGNISLKANNITKGVPMQKGKLEVNFKSNKQVVNIVFSELWNRFGIVNDTTKAIFVTSDEFLDTLARNLCKYDELTFEELCFDEKPQDDKIVEVWKLLNTIKRDNDSHYEYIRLVKYRQYNLFFAISGLLLLNIVVNIVR